MKDTQDAPRRPKRSLHGIAAAITDLLNRHEVPERSQNSTLEAVTGLSYAQVRRRMVGESPWEVEEIGTLALHFGEPLFSLLAAMIESVGVGQPAIMHAGNVRVPCTIWQGQLAQPDARMGALVAQPPRGAELTWTVIPATERPDQPAYEIVRLVFEAAAPPLVAVLDDDADLAGSVAQSLRERGLAALAYLTAEHLLTAMESARFDGFILDWQLSTGNVGALLAKVREKAPHVPIIILTGTLRDKSVHEDELTKAAEAHRALLVDKPAHNVSIYHALKVLGLGIHRKA